MTARQSRQLPIGPIVDAPIPRWPPAEELVGRYVRLTLLDEAHIASLLDAAMGDTDDSWTYMKYGAFESPELFEAHVRRQIGLPQQPFYGIARTDTDTDSDPCDALGWASYMDVSTANASIELGSIWLSASLRRTRGSTEAFYLLIDHAFALGFHRVVWRCNALNAASMHAAARLGFREEGVWRGAEIVKGRRRDTAWFSLLDHEWPYQKRRIEAWLDESNFDKDGRALSSLERRPAAAETIVKDEDP